jgi:ATP-binding cassette subfamily A (ABC1) protein 3
LIYNYVLRQQTGVADAYIAIAMTPMHGMDHKVDEFIEGNGDLLSFLIFVCYLVPVVKLISRIGTDKETKIRESMSMMGLSDTAYWSSWIFYYVMLYLFESIMGAIIIGPGILDKIDGFVLFLFFFLYGLSCMAFSMLIASIFSTARMGILIGVLVYFVTFFITFSFTASTSYNDRASLSIFNNVAMTNCAESLFSY